MKILALDSSGIVASVAVVEDDTLLAEYTTIPELSKAKIINRISRKNRWRNTKRWTRSL